MNAEKVQNIINNIVEGYRSSDYRGGRNQYPASKKYIARAEELGILKFIPNAPYSREIGNTEIQLILAEAEDAGGQVGGFNEYGEGDVTDTEPSALYQAINEVEETEPDRPAMTHAAYSKLFYMHISLEAGQVLFGTGNKNLVSEPMDTNDVAKELESLGLVNHVREFNVYDNEWLWTAEAAILNEKLQKWQHETEQMPIQIIK